MNHTPGPWKAESFSGRYNVWPISKRRDDGTAVAYDMDEANARLIAAAPDLLAALRQIEVGANTVDSCYRRNPGNFAAALCGLKEYADAARAAIARATGEQA